MLTLGFNIFTRFESRKLDDLRTDVTVEIAKNYDGKVVPYFWLTGFRVSIAIQMKSGDSKQLTTT